MSLWWYRVVTSDFKPNRAAHWYRWFLQIIWIYSSTLFIQPGFFSKIWREPTPRRTSYMQDIATPRMASCWRMVDSRGGVPRKLSPVLDASTPSTRLSTASESHTTILLMLQIPTPNKLSTKSSRWHPLLRPPTTGFTVLWLEPLENFVDRKKLQKWTKMLPFVYNWKAIYHVVQGWKLT